MGFAPGPGRLSARRQMRLRPTFDSRGRRRGHVAFYERLSPAEYDSDPARARFRPLMRAAGDVRGGDALLGDWTAERGLTPARLAASRAGRELLARLAAAVRAEFAPAAEAAARLQEAAAAAAGTRTAAHLEGGDWGGAAAKHHAGAAGWGQGGPLGARGAESEACWRRSAGTGSGRGGGLAVPSADTFLSLPHGGGVSSGGVDGPGAAGDLLGPCRAGRPGLAAAADGLDGGGDRQRKDGGGDRQRKPYETGVAARPDGPAGRPGSAPFMLACDSDGGRRPAQDFDLAGPPVALGRPGPDGCREEEVAAEEGWWWSGAEEAGGAELWAACPSRLEAESGLSSWRRGTGLLDPEPWPRLGIVCGSDSSESGDAWP
jgi:hypothetical protein